MKTLLLLRHAKAAPHDPRMRDFDRPLNERGKGDALLIGKFMREQKLAPDIVLCSPAERTRQTATLVVQSARLAAPIRYDARIYEASMERLLETVSQTEETAQTLLLIGHNPSMEHLLFALTGESHTMATAALACIILDIEKWSKAREHTGRLAWFVKAKELDGR